MYFYITSQTFTCPTLILGFLYFLRSIFLSTPPCLVRWDKSWTWKLTRSGDLGLSYTLLDTLTFPPKMSGNWTLYFVIVWPDIQQPKMSEKLLPSMDLNTGDDDKTNLVSKKPSLTVFATTQQSSPEKMMIRLLFSFTRSKCVVVEWGPTFVKHLRVRESRVLSSGIDCGYFPVRILSLTVPVYYGTGSGFFVLG